MIRAGRYRHLSGGPRRKSYGYVGNTVWQFLRLATAPAGAIHRRVYFLADYEPIALEAWADEFQVQLQAPPIRSLPLAVARAGAAVGDMVNLLGFKQFPFNSFRLNNVSTSYVADLTSTRQVCGPLPFTMQDGVKETAHWIRAVLDHV